MAKKSEAITEQRLGVEEERDPIGKAIEEDSEVYYDRES